MEGKKHTSKARSIVRRWERGLFRLLNNKLGNRRLDVAMRFISSLGSAWTSVGLCLLLWSLPGYRGHAVPVSFSVAGSHMMVQALKRLIRRGRPYMVSPSIRTVTSRLFDGSFPSGHTTAAFSIAGIFSATTGAALPLWTLAGLVGVSRVYLGHHYPTDVLGGAAIGIGFASLTIHLFA